jgi:hypothetical protein
MLSITLSTHNDWGAVRPPKLATLAVRIVAAPLLLAGAVAGISPGAPPAAAATRTMRAGSATFTTSGGLNGVAATSASNAWAVGATDTNEPLAVRWNGTTWKRVPTPDLGGNGAVSGDFGGVAATSADNAWAVGTFGLMVYFTLIEHWNGTAWQWVGSPSPGSNAALGGVAATSADNAWAVGSYFDFDSAQEETLIEHWNGTAWAQVPSPSPGTFDSLSGVTATSADNAWAVGSYYNSALEEPLIEHWNGTSWKQVPGHTIGGGFLTGVTATSASDGWAVGSSIEHWNGTAWSQVPSPNLGAGAFLNGVAATSATSAWAAGNTGTDTLTPQTVVEHWDGTGWKRLPSPTPAVGGLLGGVAATSATSAFAVGATGSYGSPTAQTLIEQFTVPAAGTGPIVSGYRITKCIAGKGGASANDTPVVMSDCDGSAAQNWAIEADGTIQINGKCLDIYRDQKRNKAPVDLWTCTGRANQQWQARNGTLVNPISGKCLDDPRFNTADGTQLQIYTCNGGRNQQWKLPPTATHLPRTDTNSGGQLQDNDRFPVRNLPPG